MKYGFGIDLGGTTVKIAYIDENGTMLEKWEIPTVTAGGGAQILPDIAASIRAFIDAHSINETSVLGLGIGVPGPVNAKGVVNKCVNLGWGVFNISEELTRLTGFQLTRGVLCAMRRRELPTVESVCKDAKRIVILENVMNPTNVGAIFRSAAALGMDALLLTPGCSDPLYRRSARVSMGTVFQVPWTHLSEGWTEQLHAHGFKTAAMALTDDSISIDDPELLKEQKLAIVLGTEGDGLKENTVASCDYTVKIPMSHGVDSLNVAAAGAVAFWQLGKR